MTRPVGDPSRASSRLPVAKRDRRPALAALALLLIVAGALGAALVVYRNGQRVDVLVAAREINAGEQVSASDFHTTRVAADAGSVVDAASEHSFIGSYAITDIPAGTLINNQMFQATSVMPTDGQIAAVTPDPASTPVDSIVTGSVVQALYAPSAVSTTSTNNKPTVLAKAVRVTDTTSSSTGNGTETFSLLVTSDEAANLATAEAQGNVVLTLLPVGTKPDIDFVKKKTS